MAAKPNTPAEREAGKGSLVAREKAEIRTRCRVCEGKDNQILLFEQILY